MSELTDRAYKFRRFDRDCTCQGLIRELADRIEVLETELAASGSPVLVCNPGAAALLKNARNMIAKIPGELRELRTGVAEQQAQIALETLDAFLQIIVEKND
jgi:hypothetical protein